MRRSYTGYYRREESWGRWPGCRLAVRIIFVIFGIILRIIFVIFGIIFRIIREVV